MNTRSKILLALIAGAALAGAGTVWWRTNAEAVPISEVSHIHAVAVDQQDPASLYLATHEGIFRTAPDGTATLISETSDDFMGFTPHPSDPAVMYASGHPKSGGNSGVLISRDAGRRWTQVSIGAAGPVDFHAIDVSRAAPNVLYAAHGRLQMSLDAGRSWAIMGVPPAGIFDVAASPLDSDTVYAATQTGIMVSRDAGQTWAPSGPEGRPAIMIYAAPGKTLFAFVVGTGLMTSPAAALDWRTLNNEFGDQVVLHLAADPNNPDRMFAVTDQSRILATVDRGRTWQPLFD